MMNDTYKAIYDAVRSKISIDAHDVLNQFDFSFDVGEIKDTILAWINRPSVWFRPKIFLDGNKWCVLYGANLQEGVAGFGDSPELAMVDFDRNWFNMLQNQKGGQ
jgi:hypothetical protein